ncbi:hypothetical protein KKI23_00355, partial [Patescibacteria group bacterium]|nr:hypothetical protein [Patescibacteria group bacterium]
FQEKLVYVKSADVNVTDSYEVYLADENGDSQLIHSFSNPQHLASTIFSIFGDNQVFAYRYQDEEGRKIIAYNGTVIDTDLPLFYDFAFSNDNKYVAYGDANYFGDEPRVVIIDAETGTKEEIYKKFEMENQIIPYLRPKAWNEDDSTIYADVVMDTEGCFNGLYEINAQTKEITSIPIFEELNVCVPSIFPKRDLAYGYDWTQIPYGEDVIDVVVDYYKIKLSDNSYTKFNLENQVYFTDFLLAPAFDLVAYSSNFNTVLADLNGNNEEIVAAGEPIAWSNNDLLAIENNNINTDSQKKISIFNPTTGEITEVATVGGINNRLEVVGWITVPK